MTSYDHLKECIRLEVIGYDKPFSWRKALLRTRRNQKKHFLFWWRIASWLYGQNSRFKKRIARRIENRLKYRHSVDISLSCKIGKGLNIAHLNGIVITDNCVIGDFADLKQGITIGLRTDSADAMIVIGDHVDIGCNSSILGGRVTIGNNVTIGAHSLVIQNIPSDTVYKNKITPVYTSKLSQPKYQEKQPFITCIEKKDDPHSAETVL
ncbi:serine acetyltransferase [Escherichia coli]|uniref:serine O-acetyltransferase n=1 Tax=Escherichia coli TaxID=562 RepID=UPI00069445E7|nr:serine acetyltransferase [Escherichia coli]EFB4090455.1 serine acetyltransferase [Escherichia coli]EFC4846188.1 serine acetyltransferase [Escherichia coli]MCV7919017.1 serine acetyltransferase [Escherichia coli]MCV8022981.1 serine acetyltransferase [Escherichia coli]MED9204193.1 serine acetyltransferase [Escherichia coli]